MKNHVLILFVLLCAMWVVVAVAVLRSGGAASNGVTHPRYQTMNHGGTDYEAHRKMLVPAWILGLLEIAVFVGLLPFGAKSPERRRGMMRLLVPGGLLYAGVFTLMCFAYGQSPGDAEPWFIGPFPAATAIMLFGVWWVPVCFVVLYVVSFDRWIATPEDLEKFQRLVAAARSSEGNDG